MGIQESVDRRFPPGLRLWPGVVLVALQWFTWLILPLMWPEGGMAAVLGGIALGVAVLVWWLFFSRLPWLDRLGALVVFAVALAAAPRVVHPSIADGMMGMMLPIYSVPPLCLALVAWAAVGSRFATGLRRTALAVAVLAAVGALALVRTGGVAGSGASDIHWRWTPSPEERLLARVDDVPAASAAGTPVPAVPPPAPVVTPAPPAEARPLPVGGIPGPAGLSPAGAPVDAAPAPVSPVARADWPGFRGVNRDGVVQGVALDLDWVAAPPAAVWRRPVGPGWSSFAVAGDVFFTQEQRGDDELVSCYRLATGAPVWRHRDKVRFWESNGGAGPRGTPALAGGRVFTFGATGLLNALDAATGAGAWRRDVATEADVKVPTWGFSSSPLVVGDVVIVAAAGRLAAYGAATGEPRWMGPARGGSYSSPQRWTADGVEQVVLLHDAGATSVSPVDGTVLWEYAWTGAAIVQPAFAADGGVLVAAGGASGGLGIRRLAVAHEGHAWTPTERWTSTGLKPYFNDMVIHRGHAYGFDGSILACIDLSDGKRVWKGGRYGNGQLVLLPEQDVLLVVSEEGELALVRATPERFVELARVPGISGKTWNHPAVVGETLLVRNGEEMAAFHLRKRQ
jgi:outer membrane protein assembly factor BamB